MYLSREAVARVGVVDAGCRDLLELLTGTGLRLGDVDDLQDLRTAESGDLPGTYRSTPRR
jgi:hypothetical protein